MTSTRSRKLLKISMQNTVYIMSSSTLSRAHLVFVTSLEDSRHGGDRIVDGFHLHTVPQYSVCICQPRGHDNTRAVQQMNVLVLHNSQVGALRSGYEDIQKKLSSTIMWSFLAIPEVLFCQFSLKGDQLKIPLLLRDSISSNLDKIENF